MNNFRSKGLSASLLMLAVVATCCERQTIELEAHEPSQKDKVTSLWREGKQLYRAEPVDGNTDRLIFWESDTLLFDKTADGCKYAREQISERYGIQSISYHIFYGGTELIFDYHKILEIELYDMQGKLLPVSYVQDTDRYMLGDSKLAISTNEPLSLRFKVKKSNRDFIQCTDLLSSSWSVCSFSYDADFRGGSLEFTAAPTVNGDTDSHLIQFFSGTSYVNFDFQLEYSDTQ